MPIPYKTLNPTLTLHIMIWSATFIVIAFLVAMYLYNSLVYKKNRVAYAYSGMDVMLKKRSDLVPALVKTVKAYATHEKETLSETIEIRNKVAKPTENLAEKFHLEHSLTRLLSDIYILSENYPALKADTNFLQLQKALHEIEEQLSAARRAYNAAVYDFNSGLETLPSSIVAKAMKYKRMPFFKLDEKENA